MPALKPTRNAVTVPREKSSSPTRLLKVTASGPFLLSVQLCLTNNKEFETRPPYLALSHCSPGGGGGGGL